MLRCMLGSVKGVKSENPKGEGEITLTLNNQNNNNNNQLTNPQLVLLKL